MASITVLLDPYVFLEQVDVKRVNYIHIAGHDEEHSAAQVVGGFRRRII